MEHKAGCPELRARTCTTPIECLHGFDVCPECDPCTCNAPKMMPGQTPYTPKELRRLQTLVGSAATAIDIFGGDELEYHQEKRKLEEKKMPVLDLKGCEANVYAVMARARAGATRAGWTAQQIGDFRGRLFTINNDRGYEEALVFVRSKFQVKS